MQNLTPFSKKLESINFFIALTLAFGFLMYGVLFPALNWDIIGYVGAAHYRDGLRGEELHKTTYQDLKATMNEQSYTNLIAGPYRSVVASDPNSLEQQMPFYTIRIIYLEAMSILHRLAGAPLPVATYWISGFFAGLFVLLLYFAFPPQNLFSTLALPVILIFSGLIEASTLSTPDSMAAFFALLCFILYLKSSRLLLPALILLPAVRTDFVILPCLIALVNLMSGHRVRSLIYLICPILVYFVINKFHANYGYLTIFNFTLIESNPFPASMPIATQFGAYLQAYEKGFGVLLGHRHFIAYLLFSIFWYKFIRPLQNKSANNFTLLVLGFIGLHMLLFPAYFQRFFIWTAAVTTLQLTDWFYQLRMSKKLK